MSYALRELRSCAPLPARPDYIPKARLRGTRARGITFERKVGAVLRRLFGTVHSGQWFEYADADRRGCCQIDHYVLLRGRVLLVECKLSESDEAWPQMSALYAPILEQHYGLPVAQVQATRHLRSGRPQVQDPRLAAPGGQYLWHLLV